MRTETENSSVLADLVLDFQNQLRKTKSVDMSNAGFSIKVSAYQEGCIKELSTCFYLDTALLTGLCSRGEIIKNNKCGSIIKDDNFMITCADRST